MVAPSVQQILAWADAHHQRTGRWPSPKGKRTLAGNGWSWAAIDHIIQRRGCGIDGVRTLVQLLQLRRGARNLKRLERLSQAKILRWADEFYHRTGRWPIRPDGPVLPGSHETWSTVDVALRVGRRGLPGGSSLAQLLLARRGAIYRPPPSQPPLTERQVLRWVDAHYRRTNEWPTRLSGRVIGVRGEKWMGIDQAMRHGRRGFPGGSTLAQFLAGHGRKPLNLKREMLTEEQIIGWARKHRRLTGRWPSQTSGLVIGNPDKSWGNIQSALYKGSRGLPGGSSIAKLLDPVRGRSLTSSRKKAQRRKKKGTAKKMKQPPSRTRRTTRRSR